MKKEKTSKKRLKEIKKEVLEKYIRACKLFCVKAVSNDRI